MIFGFVRIFPSWKKIYFCIWLVTLNIKHWMLALRLFLINYLTSLKSFLYNLILLTFSTCSEDEFFLFLQQRWKYFIISSQPFCFINQFYNISNFKIYTLLLILISKRQSPLEGVREKHSTKPLWHEQRSSTIHESYVIYHFV